MLDHIVFRNFSTNQPQEEFLHDISTGKWTLIHFGQSCTYRLDLDRAARIQWDNIDRQKRREPLELHYSIGMMMERPNQHIINRSQMILNLKNVRRIEKHNGYYLRYVNGDCVYLAISQNQ